MVRLASMLIENRLRTGEEPMRLPIIPPDKLTPEQKSLAADMKAEIAKNYQGFANIRDDGALMGPWNPWLHEPKFGKPIWDLAKAMAFNASVPTAVREIAILVTGTVPRRRRPFSLFPESRTPDRKPARGDRRAKSLIPRARRRCAERLTSPPVAAWFCLTLPKTAGRLQKCKSLGFTGLLMVGAHGIEPCTSPV
jgi:hypothetical protein